MSAAFLALSWMAISLLFLLPECQAPVVSGRDPMRVLSSPAPGPDPLPPAPLPPDKPEVPGPAGAAGAAAAWGWARRLRRRIRA